MPPASCVSKPSISAPSRSRSPVRQRRVQERAEQLLAGAVADAPGECLDVSLRRRRVGQRAGVLVDPQRERGRLHRRHRHLAVGENADERRRQGAVLRDHRCRRVGPLGQLARVVVEHDLLDRRIARDGLELRQPRGADGLDDDQAADICHLDACRLRRARARRRSGGRSRGRSGSGTPAPPRSRPGTACARRAATRTRRSPCSCEWR